MCSTPPTSAGNNLLDMWEHQLLLKDCKISIHDVFIRAICVFDLYCTIIGCPCGSGCFSHLKSCQVEWNHHHDFHNRKFSVFVITNWCFPHLWHQFITRITREHEFTPGFCLGSCCSIFIAWALFCMSLFYPFGIFTHFLALAINTWFRKCKCCWKNISNKLC